MFVSYSASYDRLLLARLKHYNKSMYYGYKRTHAQTFGSGVDPARGLQRLRSTTVSSQEC